MVRNHLLNADGDSGIRLYVVWEAILPADTEEKAVEAGRLLDDPRVTQFWSAGRFTSNAFQEPLRLKLSLPWDVVLVFGPEARWTDPVKGPVPAFFMHNWRDRDEKLPEERRLNGLTLAREVGALHKTKS